jgi:hypothetical protein
MTVRNAYALVGVAGWALAEEKNPMSDIGNFRSSDKVRQWIPRISKCVALCFPYHSFTSE